VEKKTPSGGFWSIPKKKNVQRASETRRFLEKCFAGGKSPHDDGRPQEKKHSIKTLQGKRPPQGEGGGGGVSCSLLERGGRTPIILAKKEKNTG